jgi:hypothetical protein
MGTDTKSSFNSTMKTEDRWHKKFYKDLNAKRTLSGNFEVDRSVKLHENPAASEQEDSFCEGIDC